MVKTFLTGIFLSALMHGLVLLAPLHQPETKGFHPLVVSFVAQEFNSSPPPLPLLRLRDKATTPHDKEHTASPPPLPLLRLRDKATTPHDKEHTASPPPLPLLRLADKATTPHDKEYTASPLLLLRLGDKATTPHDFERTQPLATPQKIKKRSLKKEKVSVITNPKYRYRVPPDYPQRALDLRQEGVVIVHAKVLENGKVGALKIERSSGYILLDTATLSALKKWEFEPSYRDGKAEVSWVEIPVRFVP